MSIRTWALCGSLLSVGLLAASSAQAACGVIATTGNIQWIGDSAGGGCSSDNQANDGDDLKMFVDKTITGAVSSIDGSLNENNNAFANIHVTTNSGSNFETDGSGFANFKSENANNSPATNTLTDFIFTKGSATTLPDGTPYPGFDGELFRGIIDTMGTTATYNGEIKVTVNEVGGTTETFTFGSGPAGGNNGPIPEGSDFGVLGFDEVPGDSYLISSVDISVAGTGGAWNQIKQLDFSVPGATPVPESSTWGMMLLGFAGLGYAGFRSRKKAISIV